MPPIDDSLLQPLRAYPRELVLFCAVLCLAGIIWVAVKVLKLAICLIGMAVFAVAVAGAALWLWS